MFGARHFLARYFSARYWAAGKSGAAAVPAVETGYPWHLAKGRSRVAVVATPSQHDRVTVRVRVEAAPAKIAATVSIVVAGRRDNVIFLARVEQPAVASIAVKPNAADSVSKINGRAYWDDDDEVVEMLRFISGR